MDRFVDMTVNREVRKLAFYKVSEGHIIDPKCSLSEYGIDSLGLTLLVCKLEKELGIAFERNISVSEFNSIENIICQCTLALRRKNASEE